MDVFIEEQDFVSQDLRETGLDKGEYCLCRFTACNLSGVDLTGIIFNECHFIDCDLSNASLEDSAWQNVEFEGCKMLGLRFDLVRKMLFEIRVKASQLDVSSFYDLKMPGTNLIECSLKEVDFVGADLSGSDFRGSDLSGAMFDQTRLEKADFRTARGFVISPEKNFLKKARFSRDGLPGLLADHDIVIE